MKSLMKKIYFVLLLSCIPTLSFCDFIQAARMMPESVKAIEHNGVKYMAPHPGVCQGIEHPTETKMGHIQAWDIETGEMLWGKEVYKVKYDPLMERDAQDVFIVSLKIEGDKLIVTNELNREFIIDLIAKDDRLHNLDGEAILYEGDFPYDTFGNDPYEPEKRFPFKPINILQEGKIVGTIESGNSGGVNATRLNFIDSNGGHYSLWKYGDYCHVKKIAQSKGGNIIRLYDSCTLFREVETLIEFDINKRKKSKKVLKKGRWRLF